MSFSSYASYWFLPAVQPTLHFPSSRPCSRQFPQTLPIGSDYNPPYSYPTSVNIHFPFTMHFNHEDGGSAVLQNTGIEPPHYMVQQPRKPQILYPLL
jgi:hypothetical protein